MRMGIVAATVAVALLGATQADIAAARADFQASIARGENPRYLSLATEDANLIHATQFMACAASRATVLDSIVPQRMPGTMLLRLDLRSLGWGENDWSAVCGFKNNPTTKYENPIVVEANWFLNELADGTQSGAYNRLLFGKKQPKTLDEFLLEFGVDRSKQGELAYGVIPNTSGVNLARNASRLLEHADGVNAEAWITWDVLDVKPGSDPLEGLFSNGFHADGEECYILLTRIGYELDGTAERVILPVVFLANDVKKIVTEAPGALVEDTTELFGDRIIRSPGSCFVCHTDGAQPVDGNALADRLKAGVELKAYEYAKQQQIQFFHLADTAPELERWSQGFARATWHINGLTPQQTSAAIKGAITSYRADLTLEVAAAELGCEPEKLRNALALASAAYINVGNRLAALPHGAPIPRTQWEADYLVAQKLLEQVK